MGMGPGIDLQNFFSVFCDVAELTVNPKNISRLKDINNIDGFLIGGASQNSNNFIDIIKKTFN